MVGTDEWAGKAVLIAGGAGGIGLAAAKLFIAAGVQVSLGDVNADGLRAANEALGSTCHCITADIAKVDDCARMVSETARRFGRLDLLINAAGVWVEGASETMTEAQWNRTIDINLKGTFFTCCLAIPELVKTEGQIINIASDAGLTGNAGAAIYCASKGGVVLLTKALALELAPRGVRVNAICPCDVETPMLKFQAETFGNGDPDGYLARLRSIYPQGARTRFATAEEIGEFIFAIASPKLAPITGAALSIDFGITAGR